MSSSQTSDRIRERWHLVAAAVGLVAVAFVQDAGRVVNDTKIDLVLNPGGFLQRAVQMWDPNGTFGQVQNQAYGYLFPMGPFFWLGDLVNVPDWVVQRAWWSLLLVLAFAGIVTLCSILEIGSPTARLIGGVAYALSPRILTLIGPSSIEAWPSALAPWVLVPLAIGLRRGDPRRWAVVAGLVVAAVGGVNAVATAAVLPLGVLLVLAAGPGPRRRAMMLWWPVATIAATLWWSVPLLLLGRYSPPFLDYIESAETTTFAATVFDGLRGTTHWLPYLDASQEAGNALVTTSFIVMNSVVVLALAVWGLSRTDLPHRSWLWSGVVVGLVLVTLGHGAGWGVDAVFGSLDGALSPLRNTHKFDVVVRIPMVLALVHGITCFLAAVRPVSIRRVQVPAAFAIVVIAIGGSVTPALSDDLARDGSFEEVPGYWVDAIDWLADNGGDRQNTLVLPGSAFGDYLWGDPKDEPIQALGESPWSLRNAIPLTPPGTIRALDAFETAFASGQGSRGLHSMLVRSGIRYLLVRSDLDAPGATDPELVFSTLSSTPDVETVAFFGPQIGSPPTQDADGQIVFVNGGLQTQHPPVQIFQVRGADAQSARVTAATSTTAVAGTTDTLFGADPVVGADSDVLLAQDVPDGLTPTRTIVTDTDRRQEVAFGRVRTQRSATLGASDDFTIDRPVHDYLSTGQAEWQTVAELIGAEAIRASSSVSDVDQPLVDPTGAPWAAFDGDASTAWTAGDLRGWLQIDYGRPVDLADATVTLPDGSEPRTVVVRTDDGDERIEARPGVPVAIGAGRTSVLRIGAVRASLEPLRIAELSVPSAPVSRPLRVPQIPTAWGNPVELRLAAAPGAPGCLRIGERVTRCRAGVDGRGEDASTIDRIVPLAAPAVFAGGLTVLPELDDALSDALDAQVQVRVSSTAAGEAAAGPLAMIDDDPLTGWIAELGDVSPTIDLAWEQPTEIDRLSLSTEVSLAASAPRRATLTFDDGSTQRVVFDVDGLADFDPVETTSLRIDVSDVLVRSTLGFDGSGSGLPVGVSEVSLPGSGLDVAGGADEVVNLPCGSGPTLRLGDRDYRTAVNASRSAVMARVPLPADVCGGEDLRFSAGDNRLTVVGSDAFRPAQLRLVQGPDVDASVSTAPITRDGDEALTVDGPSGRRVVAVPQTANGGWTVDDADALTVNGWMQGWLVDGGDEIRAEFAPGGLYQGALMVGASSLVLTALLAWRLTGRRDDPVGARSPSRSTAVLVVVAAVVAVGVVAGSWGVLGVVLGAVTARLLGPDRAGLVAAGGVIVAGAGYVLQPWNSPGGWAGDAAWPQALVVVSLGVAVVAGLREPRFLSLIAGRSTSR